MSLLGAVDVEVESITQSKRVGPEVKLLDFFRPIENSLASMFDQDNFDKIAMALFTKTKTLRMKLVQTALKVGREHVEFNGFRLRVVNFGDAGMNELTIPRLSAALTYKMIKDNRLNEYKDIVRSIGVGLIFNGNEKSKNLFNACLVYGSGYLPLAISNNLSNDTLVAASACIALDFKCKLTIGGWDPHIIRTPADFISVVAAHPENYEEYSCIWGLIKQGFFEALNNSIRTDPTRMKYFGDLLSQITFVSASKMYECTWTYYSFNEVHVGSLVGFQNPLARIAKYCQTGIVSAGLSD